MGSAVVTDLKSGCQFSGVDTATIYFKEFDDATVRLCAANVTSHLCN